MKKYLFLIFVFIFAFGFTASEGEPETFNGVKIYELAGNNYKTGRVLADSTGAQYIEQKFKVTPEGLLLPETGSPLDGYIVLPSRSIHLTASDLKDIFTFIDSRDLINRLQKEK